MNAPMRQTSALAVVSLVAGVLGWTLLPFLGSIAAVVTGHMARSEIRRAPDRLEGDGLAIAGLVLWSRSRHPRLLAAAAGLLWLACAVLGSVLALGWAFTDHQAMWGNRNLLLFSPLAWLLLPGAWGLLRRREPTGRFRAVLVALAVLAALACLPLWLQVEPQRNGHWIALLLPIHAALARAWRRPAP